MDSQPETPPGRGDYSAKSSILGDLRQRRILSILSTRTEAISVPHLGVQLAAREGDVAPADVPESDQQSVRIDLRHRCLPKLETVGWIERRPEGIVADEPFAIETGGLSPPDFDSPEDPLWEPVSVLVAKPRRQELLSHFADRRSSVGVDELVTELRGRGGRARTAYPGDEQRLLATLHHVDLPKLSAVDLVEYDAAERTAVRTPRLVRVADRIGLDAGRSNDFVSE